MPCSRKPPYSCMIYEHANICTSALPYWLTEPSLCYEAAGQLRFSSYQKYCNPIKCNSLQKIQWMSYQTISMRKYFAFFIKCGANVQSTFFSRFIGATIPTPVHSILYNPNGVFEPRMSFYVKRHLMNSCCNNPFIFSMAQN